MSKGTEIEVSGLLQLDVHGDGMRLVLKQPNGDHVTLIMSNETGSETAHIIADGLRAATNSEFDAKLGVRLAHGELKSPRIEKKLTALGLQEKFLLEAKTEGSTAIVLRLSEEGVRRWIDQMEQTLAQQKQRSRPLSS